MPAVAGEATRNLDFLLGIRELRILAALGASVPPPHSLRKRSGQEVGACLPQASVPTTGALVFFPLSRVTRAMQWHSVVSGDS